MAETAVQNSTETAPVIGVPFKPGQSGNPGGRPAMPAEFKERGPAALLKLLEFMNDSNRRIALKATELVVERIYGRPTMTLEHEAGADMLDALAERLQQRLTEDDS